MAATLGCFICTSCYARGCCMKESIHLVAPAQAKHVAMHNISNRRLASLAGCTNWQQTTHQSHGYTKTLRHLYIPTCYRAIDWQQRVWQAQWHRWLCCATVRCFSSTASSLLRSMVCSYFTNVCSLLGVVRWMMMGRGRTTSTTSPLGYTAKVHLGYVFW